MKADELFDSLSQSDEIKARWQLAAYGNVYFHVAKTMKDGEETVELMNPDILHINPQEIKDDDMNEDKMEHLTSFECEKEALIEEFEHKIENLEEVTRVQDSVINTLVVDKSELFNALQKCQQRLEERQAELITCKQQLDKMVENRDKAIEYVVNCGTGS